jgi:hypothetical protein
MILEDRVTNWNVVRLPSLLFSPHFLHPSPSLICQLLKLFLLLLLLFINLWGSQCDIFLDLLNLFLDWFTAMISLVDQVGQLVNLLYAYVSSTVITMCSSALLLFDVHRSF